MRYEEFDPPAALDPLIEAFWEFALEADDPPALLHPIVPDAAVSLAGAFRDGTLLGVEMVGPSARAHEAELVQGMAVRGVRLRPGACRALLGVLPATLVERIVPLPPDHWTAALFRSGFAGLADGLAARIAGASAPDMLAIAAARQLDDRTPVARVAVGLGLSVRQLHRRFHEASGLPPKTWQRVRRQRLAWINHVTGDARTMTEAAYSAGCADAAHFSREARRTLRRPAHQMAAYLEGIRHGPLRPR